MKYLKGKAKAVMKYYVIKKYNFFQCYKIGIEVILYLCK